MLTGGVTCNRAYSSPTPWNFSSVGEPAVHPRGTSKPALTVPGCVAYECTRSNTSNGFRGLPGISTTCFGSTASVYAGTMRGATRSARVDVAWTLITGAVTLSV